MTHAVVLVSGGAAVTPFTTPDAAAASGLAAGNTMTALRGHLLAGGANVYTAPARAGAGEVVEDPGWQGFAGVPIVLPAEVTVNSVGRIDDAGAALAGFLVRLAEEHGVDEFDVVGHSMGGLFARSAIAALRAGRGPAVRRLVTLGTPWAGSLLGDHLDGTVSLDDAKGDDATRGILERTSEFADENSQGAAAEVGARFLTGPDGWNAAQAGVLDGIPVTVVAGTWFAAASEPAQLWPHDGLVARRSALAEPVDVAVLPTRVSAEFDDVHSIFFADAFELPWERALTWDPAVFATVDAALS
jgi:pimeloyl-ACP methyl ester carboxylesterase